MDLGIAGRKAIVCASSKGLGRACATALAEAGCDIVINGRSAETLRPVADDLTKRFGVRVTSVAGDLGTAEARAALLAACPEPDILVNNNGGPPPKDIYAVDESDLEAGLHANFTVPALLFQAVVAGMKARGFGRILNITSGSVLMPLGGLSVSSGARAGLTAFLASAVADLAPHNVTINNLLPGPFDTDRLRLPARKRAESAGVPEQDMIAKIAATTPAARLGRPDEFGALCAFMSSAHAGFITGQNLLIDGGKFNSIF
jgi:3-oxoacyl-[acyl-carrier protein] reductase